MKRIAYGKLVVAFLFIFSIFISCNKDEDVIITPASDIIKEKLTILLDSVVDNTHVPGIVAGVWAPNEGLDFIYTGGYADLETHALMDENMIFRIGSNTKTFTITVLLQLVDEGKLSLDDKLSDFFPDYPRANEVTIEMLANMRSGIFSYTENPAFWEALIVNPSHVWTTDELIELGGDQYYFDPGTSFHYSNTNTILIGEIIEKLTGQSLETNIQNRILTPLELYNTTYIIAGKSIPGFHPKAYYGGEYDPEFPELSEMIDVSWAGAAGCMTSDIFDLAKYAIALGKGSLISSNLQQKRLNCSVIEGKEMKYGIGIFEYKGFYGHNGGLPGFTSLMVHSPEKDCTIIIWYNCQLKGDDPTQLLYKIPKMIYANL